MKLEERVESARRLLRERRLVVEPDPHFADRVMARLHEPEAGMLAWAARRVLPVTLAVAAALTVAILATHRPSTAQQTQRAGDPLDWLLGTQEGLR